MQNGEWKAKFDFSDFTSEAPLFSKRKNGNTAKPKNGDTAKPKKGDEIKGPPQLGAVSGHNSHVHAVSTMAHTEVEFVVLFTVMYSQ